MYMKRTTKQNLLWCAVAGGAALAVLLITFAAAGIFSGDSVLLRETTLTQQFPLLEELLTRLQAGKTLLYSFQSGLGTNFFAALCYYLLNPFYLVAFFFPAQKMYLAAICIVLLNTVGIAVSSAYYAQKHFRRADFTTVVFSLLYTFSGFYAAYAFHLLWLTALFFLPLLLWGLEKLVNGGKPWRFLAAFALILITSVDLAVPICIFVLLYFFVCVFAREVNKKDDDVLLLPTLLKFIASAVAGAGCAAWVILPTMFASSAHHVHMHENGLLFSPLDFFSAHFTGAGNTAAFSSAALPAVAIGSAALVLLPLYAAVKSVSKNEKGAHIVLVLFLWASFAVPVLYTFWHGMQAPTDLPYRFAFLYSFLLAKLACTVLTELQSVKKPMFVVSGVLCAAGILLGVLRHSDEAGKMLLAAGCFTAVSFLLILALRLCKTKSAWLTAALALVLAAESVFALVPSAKNGVHAETLYPKTETATAAAALMEQASDDTALSRAEFYGDGQLLYTGEYASSGNIGAQYGYNGVSGASDLADTDFAMFQYDLGNAGNMQDRFTYTRQTPIYNTLFAVSYLMDASGALQNNPLYKPLGTAGDSTVYAFENGNNPALLVNSDIVNWDGYSTDIFATQNTLWQAATGGETVLKYLPTQVRFENCTYVDKIVADEAAQEEDHDHEHSEGLSEAEIRDAVVQQTGYFAYKMQSDAYRIVLQFSPTQTQEVFVLLQSGLLNTYRAAVGEKEYSGHFTRRELISLGVVEAGTPVTLTFQTTVENPTAYANQSANADDALYCLPYGVDAQAYQDGLQALQENGTFQMTEFSETEIKGTVTAAKDCVMTVAMPYDAGWTVTIDGEATELIEHSSHWMMFSVPAGEHEIEMHYFPQGLKEGLFVSAATLLMIFLSVLLTKMRAARFAAEEAEEQRANAAAEQNPSAESAAPESETTEENPPQATE